MVHYRKSNRFIITLSCAAVFMVLFTRIITLSYDLVFHPDEHVFYLSTSSLLNSLVHPEIEFTEIKEYPEGAYLFQLPFQMLGKVFNNLLDLHFDIQVWGRVSSVVYFAISVLLGLRLIYRFLGNTRLSSITYVLIMVFSIFFIEQSRYGVGDMISLMLLMLIINLTEYAFSKPIRPLCICAAFFFSGTLAAVKYPLLFFLLIPSLAYTRFYKPVRKAKKYCFFFLLLLICLTGFFLFSPKTIQDPSYILRVIQIESAAYITHGTAHEAGGFANHLASTLVYSLLYADFPLILPIAVYYVFQDMSKLCRTGENLSASDYLLRIVVPLVCSVFFTYNLFVKLLFFRTLTPYFGIAAIYLAYAAEKLYYSGKRGKILAVVLGLVMIVRGGYLIGILTSNTAAYEALDKVILSAVDEDWSSTTTGSMFVLRPHALDNSQIEEQYDDLTNSDGTIRTLKPGELFITDSYEFASGGSYMLPATEEGEAAVTLWKEFKESNHASYVGQTYPNHYYYLFGGWIRGGTLSWYVFPCNYIYYRN